MTTEEFIAKCRDHVLTVAKKEFDANALSSDVQLVWYAKTLQNHKCIVCIPGRDIGHIYECTYNGDKEEFYIDAYNKVSNTVFPLIDKNKPRYKRIGQRIIDLGENRDRIHPYVVTPTDPFKGASNDIADLLDEFSITVPSLEVWDCFHSRDELQEALEYYKDSSDVDVKGLVLTNGHRKVVAIMKNGEWELI